MKMHFYSADAEKGMPESVRAEFSALGMRGTACGYMRQATSDQNQVTCAYCRKKMAARTV
jgi:hypothetical protein